MGHCHLYNKANGERKCASLAHEILWPYTNGA